MAGVDPTRLAALIDALSEMDAGFIEDSVSTHYLEFVVQSDECVLTGNPQGLIHLARVALQLAASQTPGAHQTFDQAGFLDRADRPLTVSRGEPPWSGSAA